MQQETRQVPNPLNNPIYLTKMTKSTKKPLFLKAIILGMIFFLPTASPATDYSPITLLQFLETEHTPRFSLLPNAFTLADNFKPTTTSSYAGSVVQVQGTAYVYHQGETTVYKLKRNLPVFTGDTLVTDKESSLSLQMIDESTLLLAAQTKLTINKTLAGVKVRNTVLQFFFGRIRALVKKLSGDYTIRTPNVFVGVRGTDFAMAVAPAPLNQLHTRKKHTQAGLLTAVLTGGKQSTVELVSTFTSAPPIQVKPFSVAGVRTGGPREEAVYVGPAAVSLLQKIAPFPEALPDIPKKYAPPVGPCWPFPVKPKGIRLKFFRVCE
ncbi:MAG: FecR family protein [Candidatus Electrothrix sp. Rat3]|nr:FecR family protein [Candidatus Electrothrix rattekaaiensis]